MKEKNEQLKNKAIVVFTDGSCNGNRGPCGAGAIMFEGNSNVFITYKRPVARGGSILLAE